MKKIVGIICMSLSVLFISTQSVDAKKKKERSTTSYSVKLHCGDCKAKLEKSIPFEKGVKKIDVNLETNKVLITFDPTKTDSKAIQAAIEELDFVVDSCVAVAPEVKKKK